MAGVHQHQPAALRVRREPLRFDGQHRARRQRRAVAPDSLRQKVGPWAPAICDPTGTYLRSLAEEHFNRIQAQASQQKQQNESARTLTDTMEINTKNRKREAAMKALARRAPRKKARSAGTVEIHTATT